MRSVTADLVYIQGGFRRGVILEIDASGRVEGLSPGTRAEVRVGSAALIPGFINAHSHAFQRALRGQTGINHPAGDFWRWRDAMYELAASLDPEALYGISVQAFREMAAAGYTAVGEFHTLHNDPEGRPYPDPGLLASRVIQAALDAGLRITLLNGFYERGGFDGDELAPAQRRFAHGDVASFLGATERLARQFAGEPRVTIGLAPHSVRAVTPESLRAIAEWNEVARRPLHIHLSEQRAEVDACRTAYGRAPIEHAASVGVLGPHTTAVHGTHATAREVALLARSGTRVCICPTTEADLGDGLVPAGDLLRAGVPLCLGSDSQARIDPFEEMRRLEQHERLRTGARNVLRGGAAGRGGGKGRGGREESGARGERGVGATLLDAATTNGAGSLGIEAGEFRAGLWADFAAIDLEHPILDGWEISTLAEFLALVADPRVVGGVWVAGRPVWLRR